MDCLFIHGNYPGQFKHLAPLLSNNGHRVVFLTNRSDALNHTQKGVEVRIYKPHRQPSRDTHHYLQSTEECILRGQAIIRELNNLLEEGFNPRFVISHGGMGLGLFVKNILPKTVHIGYFEWYFKACTTKHLVSDFSLDTQLKSDLRNLTILQEIENCDIAVVPTLWQKQQFPKPYQEKLNVIFDGIDRKFFHPQTNILSPNNQALKIKDRETKEVFVVPEGAKIISYATRGMETLRGFPEFMRSLPEILEKDDETYAVIAGADRCAYSYEAPSHKGSWKQFMLEELIEKLPLNRVFFTGLLDYTDYRTLLWRSNLHCYFTRPYVTSWSLFEAAACGARLAVNTSPATKGIVKESSITWVDLDDQFKLTQQLCEAVAKEGKRSELREGFDLETTLKHWEKLLNHAIQSN